MYAVLRSGGRQFRVEEGRTIRVPKIDAEEGARLELPEVLLLARDGEVTVGTPLVEGARVIAEVAAQGRDKKITVFKYKSKIRYRRKRGHRQAYTQLRIERILAPGEAEPAEEAPRRGRRKAQAEAAPEAPAAEAPAAEAQADAPEAEAKPRARRSRAATPEADAPAVEERPKRARSKKSESTAPEEGEA